MSRLTLVNSELSFPKVNYRTFLCKFLLVVSSQMDADHVRFISTVYEPRSRLLIHFKFNAQAEVI